MMFVQTFKRGSVARRDGHDARYTVTLQDGVGATIFFSDRPDRIVGTTPTDQFLDGLGFLEDNPPNAAMVVETAPGETDIAVVELFNPVYDPETFGVTYDVEVLATLAAVCGNGVHGGADRPGGNHAGIRNDPTLSSMTAPTTRSFVMSGRGEEIHGLARSTGSLLFN